MTGKYSVHNTLVQNVRAGLRENPMSQMELSRRSGVAQGNLSNMLNKGKPATEATWQKLFDVVWPAAEEEP